MNAIGHYFGIGDPPELVYIGANHHSRGFDTYNRWQTDCIHLYTYEGELRFDGAVLKLEPGFVSATRALSTFGHTWFREDSIHVAIHFHTPVNSREQVFVPLLQKREDFDCLYESCLEAAGWFHTHRRRAEARVWDVLWQISSSDAQSERSLHPLLAEALRRIEMRLGLPIVISEIADEVGVSHNHMIRLFKSEFGMTVQAYVRTRRVERAKHLLQHTTMPIKSVAHVVGMPDLQHFNKTMRAATGLTPRALRAGARLDE